MSVSHKIFMPLTTKSEARVFTIKEFVKYERESVQKSVSVSDNQY